VVVSGGCCHDDTSPTPRRQSSLRGIFLAFLLIFQLKKVRPSGKEHLLLSGTPTSCDL
jgi:hypothetical protein